jgi:hypothetical protein
MIHKNNRDEGAGLCIGSYVATGGEVIEVAFAFLLAHLARMALSIKEDELMYPVDIRLFSSMIEMFLPTGDTYLIK